MRKLGKVAVIAATTVVTVGAFVLLRGHSNRRECLEIREAFGTSEAFYEAGRLLPWPDNFDTMTYEVRRQSELAKRWDDAGCRPRFVEESAR